jgi:hypothetical protein
VPSGAKYIVASAAFALAFAIFFLRAPVIPAVLGAAGAGLLLYWWRQRATR